MQPSSTSGSPDNNIQWRGAPLLLVVGKVDAMLEGGISEPTRCSYEIALANGVLPAIQMVQDGMAPDLVLLDKVQKDLDCLEAISRLHSLNPEMRIVLFSDAADSHVIVRAFRLGVVDILPRPCDPVTFAARLKSLLGRWRRRPLDEEFTDLVEELGDGTFVVAASASMRLIRAQAELVAKADFPVLCLGERGAGKETIARLLHQLSPRSSRPFMKVNCAALPAEVVERELFGHERGASSGSRRLKPGKLESCSGGTILLDEIEALSFPLQTRLLDAVQDREFKRANGDGRTPINARIIAATNADVKTAFAAQTFREDLYRHLSAFVFKLPPLRERREDIPMLLQHYIDLFALRYALPLRYLTPQLIEQCQDYSWPGNIRELENFVMRYLVLGVESFDLYVPDSQALVPELAAERNQPAAIGELKELRGQTEATAIAIALDRTQWNRKAAAGLLSISYKTLLYKIRRYSIDKRHNSGVRQSHVLEMQKTSKPRSI